MGELAKRLVEVEEILSYLPYEDLLKIPEEIWRAIQSEKDATYVWKYDESLPLKDQNVHKDTIFMLSYLNIKYLLNEEEKKFVKELLEFNEKKKASTSQIEKNVVNTSVNYNSNEKNEKIEEVKEIVEYKSNFFAKLIDKIKSWFYKF